MQRRKLWQLGARILMAAGLAVGVLGMLMWTFGFRVRVPEWMWRVAVIKLTLAAAIGLVGAGAMLLRYLKKTNRIAERTAEVTPNEPARALGAPPPVIEWQEREPQRVTTPPDPHAL